MRENRKAELTLYVLASAHSVRDTIQYERCNHTRKKAHNQAAQQYEDLLRTGRLHGHSRALDQHGIQATYFRIYCCLLKFAPQRVIEFPARSQIALQNRVCRLVTSKLEGELDLLVVLDLQHI